MRAVEGSAFIRFQSLSQMEFAFTAAVSFRRREAKEYRLVHSSSYRRLSSFMTLLLSNKSTTPTSSSAAVDLMLENFCRIFLNYTTFCFIMNAAISSLPQNCTFT